MQRRWSTGERSDPLSFIPRSSLLLLSPTDGIAVGSCPSSHKRLSGSFVVRRLLAVCQPDGRRFSFESSHGHVCVAARVVAPPRRTARMTQRIIRLRVQPKHTPEMPVEQAPLRLLHLGPQSPPLLGNHGLQFLIRLNVRCHVVRWGLSQEPPQQLDDRPLFRRHRAELGESCF